MGPQIIIVWSTFLDWYSMHGDIKMTDFLTEKVTVFLTEKLTGFMTEILTRILTETVNEK